jgi:hypothetical protein
MVSAAPTKSARPSSTTTPAVTGRGPDRDSKADPRQRSGTPAAVTETGSSQAHHVPSAAPVYKSGGRAPDTPGAIATQQRDAVLTTAGAMAGTHSAGSSSRRRRGRGALACSGAGTGSSVTVGCEDDASDTVAGALCGAPRWIMDSWLSLHSMLHTPSPVSELSYSANRPHICSSEGVI